MPVRNLGSRPKGIVYIPTTSITYTKIQIIDDSNTTHTVLDTYSGADDSNYTISATLSRTATEKLSIFKITLSNINGRYMNKFNGGEYVHIYADSTDATTHIFTGRIDNVKYGLNTSNGWIVNIIGRDYPQFTDKMFSDVVSAVTGDIAIGRILHYNYSDVVFKFWNGNSWSTGTYDASDEGSISWSPNITNFPTTLINSTYKNKKGIIALKEICNSCGLDFYIDYNVTASTWSINVFLSGADINKVTSSTSTYGTAIYGINTYGGSTIISNNIAVAYGVNLLSVDDYGLDNNRIYNRVSVYGKTESDNILLLKTEENTSSQSNLWIKDKIITSNDLESMDEVQDKANSELTIGINTDNNGGVSAILLHSLRPGQTINVSIPYTGIHGNYVIKEFIHDFSKSSTKLQFNKINEKLTDLFVRKVNSEEFISSLDNVNDMKDSYTVFFNESPSLIEHISTEEVDGRLQIKNNIGVTTMQGVATSINLVTDYDVTSCEFRAYTNDFIGEDILEVSNQGGANGTWDDITDKVKDGIIHTFSVSGNNLKFKITLNRISSTSPSPSYESVCLLYK